MNRLRGVVAIIAAYGCASGLATVPAVAEDVAVVGGTAAIARLLGYVDCRPEAFVASLNRVLLADIDTAHDWTKVSQRRQLGAYLASVSLLDASFPGSVTVGLDAAGRRAMEAVATQLGYELLDEATGRVTLLPSTDELAAGRRRAAAALGWSLVAAAEGRSTVLTLTTDRVAAPLPLSELSAIAGRPITSDNALAELVRDQRLGLVLAGRGRLTRATQEAIDGPTWRWIYERAATEFHRYAASFEVVDGALVVPGGDGSTARWSVLVGVDVTEPGRFLRALLTAEDGRAVHVWHALRFAPPALAARHARDLLAAKGHGARVVRRGSASHDGHGPFARPNGLGQVVRTMSAVDALDGTSERRLAMMSQGADNGPRGRRRGTRSLARGGGGDPGLGFLRRSTEPGGSRTPIGDGLRAMGSLWHRAEREPSVMSLATQISRCCQPALAVLDALDELRPETVELYLRAVRHVDAFPRDAVGERSLMSFQAGTELLRLLAQGGRVPLPVLDVALERWARAHLGIEQVTASAAVQRDWLASLLAELPPVATDAPGRGPLESRWLAAIVPFGPTTFHWGGLEYEGDRGRAWARTLVAQLRAQGIPTVDAVLASRVGASELAEMVRAVLLAPIHLLAIGERPNVLLRDTKLIESHRLVRPSGAGPDYDASWRSAVVLTGDRNGGEPYVLGHPASTAEALVEYVVRGDGRGVAAYQRRQRVWVTALGAVRWDRLEPRLAQLVSALIAAGREIEGKAEFDGHAELDAIAERVPRARLEASTVGGAGLSVSDHFAIGLATFAGDAFSGAAPERLSAATRAQLTALTESLGANWRSQLHRVGVPTTALNGHIRPWLGTWIPYEALENEVPADALLERELLDVYLAVVDYIGRRSLPAEIGALLLARAVKDASLVRRLEGLRDWEGHLRWVRTLDDDHFDAGVYACLQDGLYAVRR